MCKGLSNHAGFSLVELMVAMIIGLFLTLGVFTMFSMSSSNVTTTSQFNQLQENGRIALALMERDISQLGFMGDITGTELVRGVNTTLLAAIIPTGDDCIGGGINNASFPNTTLSHFRKLWGYEAGVGTESLACLTNVVKNTDVIQIKRLSGPPTSNPNDVNRYYIGATANQAIIFSGSQPTPTLDNGRFWEYVHHVYYIQNDGSIPVLRRRLLLNGGMNTSGSYEQLVEGIENMRILYGFDNDGNDTADIFMPAQNVTSLMWDNEQFQRLVAIRIFLLVRSTDEDSSYTNDTKYILGDKIIAATQDHFRRKVVSTTIVLENPVLIRQ